MVDMPCKDTNDTVPPTSRLVEAICIHPAPTVCLTTRKIAHAVLLSTYTQHELERYIFFAIRESKGTGLASYNGLCIRGYSLYGVLEKFVRPTLRQGLLMAVTRTCCYVTESGTSVVKVYGLGLARKMRQEKAFTHCIYHLRMTYCEGISITGHGARSQAMPQAD